MRLHIKCLPSGTGSIHSLPRSLGMLSACASLWACFSSLLSLAKALWVMAARCKEPSGFCVTHVTWQVHGLIKNVELENFKLCSPLSRNSYVLCSYRLFKLKTEGQTIQKENLNAKVQSSNPNSGLSWVSPRGRRIKGRGWGKRKRKRIRGRERLLQKPLLLHLGRLLFYGNRINRAVSSMTNHNKARGFLRDWGVKKYS